MGLVINQEVTSVQASDVFTQLNIPIPEQGIKVPVHFGGPVESSRGFVLHSADYSQKETVVMDTNIALTCNVNILEDIAKGAGPSSRILALGYAGWTQGQLEKELQEHSWLVAPAANELIFSTSNTDKWSKSIESLGFDLSRLSPVAGRA